MNKLVVGWVLLQDSLDRASRSREKWPGIRTFAMVGVN